VILKKNERGPFAFIEFSSPEEAEKGLRYGYLLLRLSESELQGQAIKVSYAKPKAKGCFKCKQEGHFAKDCPETEGNGFEDRPKRSGAMTCHRCQK
jgi:arginine/serine-rich splicing factor 7